jgi:hypothetical protein
MQGTDIARAESAPLEPVKAHRRHRRAGLASAHSPLAPRPLPMPPQDLRVLVQEHPIELVERVAGLMRIPALGHGGIGCLRRSRAKRSSVLIALAFAIDWRPDRGLERASRRSSSNVAASRTGPVLMGSKGAGWGWKFQRFL